MDKKVVPYDKIVFVCVHERQPETEVCCSGRGSVDLHAALKDRIKSLGLAGRIRVSRSGCLNRCMLGPNIMVFPDNCWYSGVTVDDLDTVVEELVAGLPQE